MESDVYDVVKRRQVTNCCAVIIFTVKIFDTRTLAPRIISK